MTKEVEEAYIRAIQAMEKDLYMWFKRYMKNNQVSYATARQELTKKERKELLWDVEAYIKYAMDNEFSGEYIKELENASIRVHIERIRALQLQLQYHIQTVYEVQSRTATRLMESIFEDGMYKTAYEVQVGLGKLETFQKMDTETLSTIINKPWTADKKNFSSRIWTNKDLLVDELQKELTYLLIRGENPEKGVKRLADRMAVDMRKARRLLLTESAFFGTEGERQSFKRLNVAQYEICATLDNRTSEICQNMDGKVFDLSDMKAGINAPPFHCHCRSCTVPYFDDMDETRIARDEHGKNITVKSMSYKEWKSAFLVSQAKKNER